MATGPSTKAISPIPTSRTRARAGRSSPCGTTTNSRGKVGKASRRPARRGPGQSIKVAANQAWWEYLPSRCKKVSGPSLESFDPPAVTNVAIEKWDENGLGDEPNNLAAINSLIGYRSHRYGKHLDLIITDQHSYRSADAFSDPAAGAFGPEFTDMFPEDVAQVLDGGRAFNGGNLRRKSASMARMFPIRSATHRRRRSSAPSRKPGSKTSSAIQPRRGKSGAIRKAHSTRAPTRKICRRA